jgi:hypothetical protein
MVHNFGKGAGRTASELGLPSVCLERHEPTRSTLVEWVLGFLEGYPLSYPRVDLPHPPHPRAPRPNSGFD